MSDARWSIAAAKAGFSRLVADARTHPQVIENRGRAVAVVLSTEEYERLTRGEEVSERWSAFLDASTKLRARGGVTLALPRRRPRRSPL